MERMIDDSDSLRKAEEIYSRRKGINIENEKKSNFSIYKLLFQVLILINLAIVVIVYQNKNWIFTQEFLNKVNEFYSINITNKIEKFLSEDSDKNTVNNEIKEESNTENAIYENAILENEVLENKPLSNIDRIKESYSFEKPIEGTITSFFGDRESKNPKVSGYHTGIDISATEGTKIKSAIEGNVILISSEGNYGKHLKIQKDDIITLYAHCSKILVNEGDMVNLGQEIAEVGSTGNSTGPHLHFEIRENNEYIDPLEIIKF